MTNCVVTVTSKIIFPLPIAIGIADSADKKILLILIICGKKNLASLLPIDIGIARLNLPIFAETHSSAPLQKT